MTRIPSTSKQSRRLKTQLMLGFLIIICSCEWSMFLHEINGLTMGTTYSVKVVTGYRYLDKTAMQTGIDSILQALNRQVSNWDMESEISRFNHQNSYARFFISDQFKSILTKGEEISRITQGAFDFTIYPLLKLWGFGPEANHSAQIPDETVIRKTLNHVGIGKLEIGENNISKIDSLLQLDLNAIAKGFGVDLVFEWLKKDGYNDIFIEIGGEVRCSGMNLNGFSWRVGVDMPNLDSDPGDIISAIVKLNNTAIATSGNYRNFLGDGGIFRAHIIDPRTGYPTNNGIVSVSVLAADCLTADAFATALMVLDLKAGMSLINNQKDLEAFWIMSDDEDKYQSYSSKNFQVTEL